MSALFFFRSFLFSVIIAFFPLSFACADGLIRTQHDVTSDMPDSITREDTGDTSSDTANDDEDLPAIIWDDFFKEQELDDLDDNDIDALYCS